MLDALGIGFLFAQPYLLLRLVGFFQEVPRLLRLATAIVPVIVAVGRRWLPGSSYSVTIAFWPAVYLTRDFGYARDPVHGRGPRQSRRDADAARCLRRQRVGSQPAGSF